MTYPTPMDVAEAEDREADLSPSERLANICSALEESLNESPFTREEWERLDAERLELLAANDTIAARLAEVQELLRGVAADATRYRKRLAEAEALLRVMPGYGLSAYDKERWEKARNAFLAPASAPAVGAKLYRLQDKFDPYRFTDFDARMWNLIVVPADQPSAVEIKP